MRAQSDLGGGGGGFWRIGIKWFHPLIAGGVSVV